MSTAHYGRAVPLALRRFRRLPCVAHAGPLVSSPAPTIDNAASKAADATSSSSTSFGSVLRNLAGSTPPTVELPTNLPPGVHVVLLLSRLNQIEHADSWLSVREAWERLLTEKGVKQQGEMQMYICCLLPRFWPLRWLWHRRIGQWSGLLGGEYPFVHVISTTAWANNFHERMHIHDDGRAYAMVIRNDGEILWASHDKFKEHLQERTMVNVVNRECDFRINEQDRLLEGGQPAAKLDAETASGPSASTTEVDGVLEPEVQRGAPIANSEHPATHPSTGSAEHSSTQPGKPTDTS